MLVIGITGGSGTGKTTVSRAFEKLGGKALDADAIYHEKLMSSAPMRREILGRFPEAEGPEGHINRSQLARIVFSNDAALYRLNELTHKYVIAEIERRMGDFYRCNIPVVLIDAVALFESGVSHMCDVTVGVLAPKEERVRRIMERDGMDRARALARINAQQDDEFYRSKCDYILENGPGASVEEEAETLYNHIMEEMEISQ